MRLIALLDELELLYLAAFLAAGLVVLVRALAASRSVTATRQLRWIVWGTALGAMPFALGYAVPFALGVAAVAADGAARPFRSAFIPLAFASAIVRYRLMDVEVILKRLLVYTAAVAASVAIYVVILRTSGGSFIQSEDGASLADRVSRDDHRDAAGRPVKDAVQRRIDRAFYRDRYDYRRALVAFARDLNGDLDLDRLADAW